MVNGSTMKRVRKSLVGAALICTVMANDADAAPPADLVIRGGQVITMDVSQPVAESVACRDKRIVYVGSNEQAAAYIGPQTQIIEAEGLTVIPGFIEGHGHFVGLGRSKMILDLSTAQQWEDIVAMVEGAAETALPGEWIIGRGWHQSKWNRRPQPNVEGYPVHESMSRVSDENPVRLIHASGHMSMANHLALKLAGINKDTADPRGGEILRDADGQPTGVLRESAQSLLTDGQRRTAAQSEELSRAIQLATEECLRNGITTFQDAGSSFAEIDTFRELAESGRLGVRLWVMVRESNARLRRWLADYRMIGVGDHHLTVRAVKRSIDGALGSHGAWLLEPYEDLSQSTGLQALSLASLRETAEIVLEHDCQLCVHAIGDRANREVLDVFESACARTSGGSQLRWRIEHAQHLHPVDIPRFAGLGVVASMQGIHCTSDAAFVVERLGERRAQEGAYVWRSLLDSGAVVTNGTDTPVESVSPIRSFYASVTRRTDAGAAFFPDQRMTRAEALKSYTLDAAYAGFEEELKGSLEPGKLADLVVLSQDLLHCPVDEILSTEIIHTIVGGRVLYSRDLARTRPGGDAATRPK